ncbi:MAG TPA: FecR domain-containing protein [Bauldia sp.]
MRAKSRSTRVRGAFRFLTGGSPKDAYSINTPMATIAVRGTEFDLDVEGQTGKARLAHPDDLSSARGGD